MVEDILLGLEVQWLVVPSVKTLVGMWTCKFGFLDLSMLECEALEDRIVTPDTSSATMLKKKIYRHLLAPCIAQHDYFASPAEQSCCSLAAELSLPADVVNLVSRHCSYVPTVQPCGSYTACLKVGLMLLPGLDLKSCKCCEIPGSAKEEACLRQVYCQHLKPPQCKLALVATCCGMQNSKHIVDQARTSFVCLTFSC